MLTVAITGLASRVEVRFIILHPKEKKKDPFTYSIFHFSPVLSPVLSTIVHITVSSSWKHPSCLSASALTPPSNLNLFWFFWFYSDFFPCKLHHVISASTTPMAFCCIQGKPRNLLTFPIRSCYLSTLISCSKKKKKNLVHSLLAHRDWSWLFDHFPYQGLCSFLCLLQNVLPQVLVLLASAHLLGLFKCHFSTEAFLTPSLKSTLCFVHW